MKEYDLFIPMMRGKARALGDLKKRLSRFFGGVTFFPQRNEGLWKFGAITFKDKIVILRVLASRGKRAERFLHQMKKRIEKDFDQREVLIVARDIEVI